MFSREPDIFELALPDNTEHVSVVPFESEWGITDELLCYYQNTLIGLVAAEIAPQYPLGKKSTFIYLLPKLDRKRQYPLPSVSEFLSAVRDLLSKVSVWNLRCEYDCDQNPVAEIQENLAETLRNLESAVRYSEGKATECPTFNAVRSHG